MYSCFTMLCNTLQSNYTPVKINKKAYMYIQWNIIQPLKNNDIGSNMELEIVILSEISQTQKDKYHMISLICAI